MGAGFELGPPQLLLPPPMLVWGLVAACSWGLSHASRTHQLSETPTYPVLGHPHGHVSPDCDKQESQEATFNYQVGAIDLVQEVSTSQGFMFGNSGSE